MTPAPRRELPLDMPVLPRRWPDTASLRHTLLTLPADDMRGIERRLSAMRRSHPAPFRRLADPLSPHLPATRRHPPLVNRSAGERVALSAPPDPGFLFSNGDALAGGLTALRSGLGFAQRGLRTVPVWSEPDSLGVRVRFAPATDLPHLLDKIADIIRPLLQRDRVCAGIVAMTLVAAVHPFEDGNGRISRMLFNATAPAAGYFPIYELGLLSEGGWLLALRRAQTMNDWSTLTRWLTAAATIAAAVPEGQDLPGSVYELSILSRDGDARTG